MNIFVLDQSPVLAARYHCDKHVVKMVLKTAQILSTVLHSNGIHAPYKPAHVNHPCTKWAGKAYQNYYWLCRLDQELSNEYTARYGKIHASDKVIEFCWEARNMLELPGSMLDPIKFIYVGNFPAASDSVVENYRQYYRVAKVKFATWRHPATMPNWFTEASQLLETST